MSDAICERCGRAINDRDLQEGPNEVWPHERGRIQQFQAGEFFHTAYRHVGGVTVNYPCGPVGVLTEMKAEAK